MEAGRVVSGTMATPVASSAPSSSTPPPSSLLDRIRAGFYRIPYRWRFMGTVQLMGAAFILTIMSQTRDNHRNQQQQHSNRAALARSSHSTRSAAAADSRVQ